MSELKKLHQNLALALGEDESAIKAENPKWLALMKEGVLISLHIGRWRARTQLTWDDLGLKVKADKQLQSIINLGHKNLLPADLLKQLDNVESKAREWVRRKSFQTHWGQFTPSTAYADWKQGNENFRDEYFALRDQIVRDYDNIMMKVLTTYEVAALQAFERLSVLAPDSLTSFDTEEDFVKSFVRKIRQSLPTRGEIESSFYFDVELRYVPLPSLLAEDTAEKNLIEARAQADYEAIEQERALSRDRAWAEREKQNAEVRAARDAAEWKKELMIDMHKDIIDQARSQKADLVDNFLRDVTVQLRSLVYDATTNVLAALQKNDSLPSRSVVQLKNMISQVASLNFYGDNDIEEMIKTVQPYLDQSANDRNAQEIEKNLQDIATVTRASLIGLGEKPRQSRGLGVADQPSAEMVRTSRRKLGLDQDFIDIAPASRRNRLLDVA